jgi:hypothetical protein
MAQIEPVEFLWVNGEIKLGVNLRVYILHPFLKSNRVKAEITDIDDKLLFVTILNATSYEDVAQKLNLKLKTDTVDNRKELLTEIMEADAKDGLYEQEKEWVFQFDDDEPRVVPDVYYDAKKLFIEIENTSNIVFTDGNGKNLKIFAREKQLVNTINLEPNGTNHLGLDTNNLK